MLEGYDVIRVHLVPFGLKKAKSGQYRVVTTYRNPEDVADSWARRNHEWKSDKWREQWEAWAEVVPLAERVYRYEDLTQHLGILDPIRTLHEVTPPKEDIIFAKNICREFSDDFVVR